MKRERKRQTLACQWVYSPVGQFSSSMNEHKEWLRVEKNSVSPPFFLSFIPLSFYVSFFFFFFSFRPPVPDPPTLLFYLLVDVLFYHQLEPRDTQAVGEEQFIFSFLSLFILFLFSFHSFHSLFLFIIIISSLSFLPPPESSFITKGSEGWHPDSRMHANSQEGRDARCRSKREAKRAGEEMSSSLELKWCSSTHFLQAIIKTSQLINLKPLTRQTAFFYHSTS